MSEYDLVCKLVYHELHSLGTLAHAQVQTQAQNVRIHPLSFSAIYSLVIPLHISPTHSRCSLFFTRNIKSTLSICQGNKVSVSVYYTLIHIIPWSTIQITLLLKIEIAETKLCLNTVINAHPLEHYLCDKFYLAKMRASACCVIKIFKKKSTEKMYSKG